MKVIGLGANNPHVLKIINRIKDIEFLGFIDNDKSKKDFFGYKIFGGIDVISTFDKDVRFCNFITRSCQIRHDTTQQMLDRGVKLCNIIDPSVDCFMVELGTGLFIQENVILQAGVTLHDNVSVHVGSMISHETSIGESSFVSVGCHIAGCVNIGERVFVGTGASIIPRKTIGNDVTIGAGAVITKDVMQNKKVVGVNRII